MVNRSNAYDLIAYTVQQLNSTMKNKENIILKANDDSARLEFFDEHIEKTQQENQLSKSLQQQVETLHSDYVFNRINYARVAHALRPVTEFFKSNPNFNPNGFDRKKIQNLLDRYRM